MAGTVKKDGIKRLILIIDDEHVNRRLLGKILEEDYDVLYAEDGEEALNLIKKRVKTLSAILLDLMMPKVDGFGVLTALRDDSALSRIPVIVLTSDRSAEVKSLELGAADFITKPYDMPAVIRARVRRSIELAEDNSIIRATEIDSLTGLYTKEFFFQHGRRYDCYYPDNSMDAVVIDINRFHLINELNGRLFGDNVLTETAALIKNAFSDNDGIVCRCDSDTFFVYTAHRENYGKTVSEISSKLSEKFGNSRIDLRMGIYPDTDKSLPIEVRFDRASHACNTLRNSYSSGFMIYDDRMRHEEIYSEKLICDMDVGVNEHQFKVYYQPKYNITGIEPVLVSAEALIRWEHPEYGMVAPANFVPLFEENGLVQKLDHYVWREAAAQISRWKEKFGITIPVSVNVSRIDIYNPELEKMLLDIVKENNLEPYDFPLEITESAYTDNSEQIVETVRKLREDGFRVEMDDFGAGYSSLNMLASLPIDALKLDMVFIKKVCDNEKDKKMVQLMIDIARFLNLPVVAEGVETKEQCELLRSIGCDIIQGFYFSKPVPADEFEDLIKEALNQH